jgi:hypothetical protein
MESVCKAVIMLVMGLGGMFDTQIYVDMLASTSAVAIALPHDA